MARLPDANDLGQRPIPRPNTSVATVRNAGAVGEAVAGIGAQVSHAGDVIQLVTEQRKEQEARLQAAQARSNFMSQKIGLDGELEHDTEYDTLEKRYTEGISKISTETAASIKSPYARAMFEADVKPDVERGIVGIRQKVFDGHKDTQRAEITTTLASNLDSLLASQNEGDRVALLNSSQQMLANAKAAGYISPEEEATQRLKFTEQYAKGRLSLMPDGDQVITLGSSLLASEAHPDGKTGTFVDYIPRDDRVDLLRSAEARVRAEDSRTRADLRFKVQGRLDDAKELARLVDDGVPVPVETIDQQIANAREVKADAEAAGVSTGGIDAMIYRLGVGKVKTTLSLEYKASTPQELQAPIDQLSAKISKAGDKAKPEDVIARDHLVTMRDKAKELIGKDPLEFAARAWGVDVPPIDWNDPKSVQSRGRLALTVSQRAGAPLAPLRGNELDLFHDEYNKGADGKVAVLDKISMFGPGVATAAARQIAPNDEGFRVAAGLATSPLSGRGISRDAITGGDALTGAPDLFKKDRADRLYGSFVNPALRLLPPELRKGVYEAGKNIYAARMTRNGQTDWNEPQWWQGVNAALGQYRDEHGTYRGGLTQYKKGLLLLPTGVSKDEFESTIAKINPTALGKSGNGKAVWSNGTPVKWADLPKLSLIADGDGSYRLTDGDGYVMSAGGGPFRIDYRKLAREVGK
jgi:hypothetical protein